MIHTKFEHSSSIIKEFLKIEQIGSNYVITVKRHGNDCFNLKPRCKIISKVKFSPLSNGVY